MASLSVVFDLIARDKASREIKSVGDAFDDTSGKGSRMGKALSSPGVLGAVAAVGAGAAALAIDAVKAASSLQQSSGAIETVFGSAAKQVEDYAKRSGRSIGLAQDDYQQLAAVVGSQLQRMGQSQDESAQSTDKLIGLGADLAATYGGSVNDAIGAVGSLLRGERDPIERYGVGINDAAIKAKLLDDGLGDLTGAALDQAKQQAVLTLLTEQTSKAQGAAARESGTLEGQTTRLKAQYKDLTGQIGEKLIPVASGLFDKIQDLIDGFREGTGTGGELRDAFERLKKKVDENRPAIDLVVEAVGKFVKAIIVDVIPAVASFAVETLPKVVDAFKFIAGGSLSMASEVLGAFKLMVDAAAKIPGPLGDPFRQASLEILLAKAKVDALKAAVENLPNGKKVNIDADTSAARRAVQEFVAYVGSANGTVNFSARAADRMGDGPGRGGPALSKVSRIIAGSGAYVTSTYRTPAQNAATGGSPTSYHLDRNNPAVDIGGPTGVLNNLYRQMAAMGGWRELLWRVPGHYDHIHAAHQGGTVEQSWASLPGMASSERPAVLQVGEHVSTQADMAAMVAEMRALRDDFRRFPSAVLLAARTA